MLKRNAAEVLKGAKSSQDILVRLSLLTSTETGRTGLHHRERQRRLSAHLYGCIPKARSPWRGYLRCRFGGD